MGVTWKTPEQTEFLEGLISTYFRFSEGGKLKDFWIVVTKDWFERFPLGDPSNESIAKEGTRDKAIAAAKAKKLKIKRFFANIADTGLSGRQSLHLEEGRARKRSEVQSYMVLFYESRIRPTVLARWASDKIHHLGSNIVLNIPESEILPEDSHLLKDTKIPISYKNMIAQELWGIEDEAIKKEVLSRRQSDTVYKTVYNTDGEERLGVVREYAKNISSLQRNMGNVLRNVDRKCAGKGIMWIACPSPLAGGKPVGYFQCIGEAVGSKDFEAFIGTEKAREFKALFGAWIQKIYPSSEWSMFSLDQAADDPPTDDQTEAYEEDTRDNGFPPNTSPPVASEQAQAATAPADHGSSTTTDDTIVQLQAVQHTGIITSPNALATQVQPLVLTKPTQVSVPAIGNIFLDDTPDVPPALITPTQVSVPAVGNSFLDALDVPPAPAVPTQVLVLASDDTSTSDTSDVYSQPATINPSLLLMEPIPQPAQMCAGGQAPRPGLSESSIPSADDPSLFNLPEDAREPIWMKKKGTLRYFRSAFKMGGLSGLISNWYRLEEALGFPEQTQKAFPTKNRPGVVATFLKNGHNYKRDYGLEARSLGPEILTWWRDIRTTHVGFGGPTGIYTMVVLISWWCSLLKDQCDSERADYVVIVEELNRAILAALQHTNQPGAAHSSTGPSLLTTLSPPPPPNRRNAKRAAAEEIPPRKRSRI